MFLAGETLPRADVAAAIDTDAALAAGLLAGEADLSAPLAVDEWQGFYVAHDHESQFAFDHVAGISNATRTLAALTVRRPVRRALDLGTGCGVAGAALVSRHAEYVVATDINGARAATSRGSMLDLNDVANVELREGSLFEPVVGRAVRSDRVQPAVRRLTGHGRSSSETPASKATRSRGSSSGARPSISSRAALPRC